MANIQIKSNQESVNPNLGQRVAPHANVTVPYEAGQKVWGSIRHGLDWYNNVEEQRDALRAVQATNTANEMIGKLKIDYQENYQGSNAVDMAQKFEQDSRRIMQECYANSGIKYKKSETMYNRNVGNTISNGNVWAYKYETDQVNKAKMDNVTVAAGNYYENWRTGGMPLSQSISDLTDTVDFLFSNRPKEIREQIISQQIDRWAADSVQESMTTGNYGAAMAILGETDKYLSPQVKTKLNGMVYKARTQDEDWRLAKRIVDENLSPEQQEELFKKMGMTAGAKGNYGFNAGVSLNGMQEYAIAGLDGISGFLNFNGINDIIVTSARGDYGGHVSGSAHDRGEGIDLDSATLAAMSTAQRNAIARNIEQMFPGVKVINEYDNPSSASTGGHFHLDFTDYRPSNAQATQMRKERVQHLANAYKVQLAREQRQQQLQNRQNFYSDIFGGNKKLSEIINTIQNSNDIAKQEDKDKLCERATDLFASGTALFSQKTGMNLVNYLTRGDYIKDSQLLSQYLDLPTNEQDDMDEKERQPYVKAWERFDDFMTHIYGRRWKQQNNLYKATPPYRELMKQIQDATNEDVDQAAVINTIRRVADEMGWDADQIINDVEWEKMGKGYKRPSKG